MRYLRIYADRDGESHMEEIEVASNTFADPVRGLLAHVSDPISVDTFVFRWVLSETEDAQPHTAPRRQFLIQLSGECDVETSDGDVRRLAPGAVVLAEDTDGKGHITRSLSDGRMTLVVTLPDEEISAGEAYSPIGESVIRRRRATTRRERRR